MRLNLGLNTVKLSRSRFSVTETDRITQYFVLKDTKITWRWLEKLKGLQTY